MVSRLLYTLLLRLATPLVLLRLLRRSRQQPEYRRHWGERFGLSGAAIPGPVIWVHAVSVGETRAAQPLLAELLAQYPQHSILLTGMTPTGRDTATQVFAALGQDHAPRLHYRYLPYDYPGAVSRFLERYRPSLGLLMETELWPNLLHQARHHGVPMLLVNARLSARSARGYSRWPGLFAPALAGLDGIAAQTPDDAARLQGLGAKQVSVCGNLKFDVQIAPALRQQGQDWRRQLAGRTVWLAASTREGEEALILDACAAMDIPDLLLLLVPRHPQRFNQVEELVRARGLGLVRRSQGLPTPETRVWLGDSMGEMAAYFSCADLAVMGGSLLPFGGQNLIEGAACGCPLLLGPHTFNFAQAAEDAVAAGAALRLEAGQSLASTAQALLRDKEKRRIMSDAASAFAAAHGGATARTMDLIRSLIAPAGR
ncbi:lipid IV(A) 3-deoxy-D-manno-octulosonic acid transferase [Azospira sp. I09]|uniref:lipid IV(A) 3-deoxy-D-manno-octulosonic acid transferase n=1 Tax=Azospira sp. I09 TaxID=1765049 RepID=UPI0012610E95|nr:lipid IV(A) 3-deoxy-D-manno-octulosonic acid transferase [Azospira sp. I09]BBN88965.1 3-deoxy-D-manno-octulosonic acid transferase [Azospira sp. I09]